MKSILGRAAGNPEVLTVVRALIWLARLVAPRRAHIVVFGWPDHEGNSVEVVRWLMSGRDETVFWIVESLDRATAEALLGLDPGSRLHVVDKRQGFVPYLTATVVFVTHGLYQNPRPIRRKPIVNLWHGDGPKATRSTRTHRLAPSTVMVSGAERFALKKRKNFTMGRDQMVIVGNPRWDQLRRPLSDAELTLLGIVPELPILLYMPTFRRARSVGTKSAWADGGAGGLDPAEVLSGLVDGGRESGVQVVVKPHPYDAEEYDGPGVTVITDAQLQAAHLLTYRLLARATGLVTDYSSVWTDFLTLDRPIGFAVADLDEYGDGRGQEQDVMEELLPGPNLVSREECASFARQLCSAPESWRELRSRSAERIGLVRTEHATADLISDLARRGIMRPTR